MTQSRRGFALLTVLWTVVLVGALAARASSDVRLYVLGSRNRADAVRALWAAKGCQASALARAARVFDGRMATDVRDRQWRLGLQHAGRVDAAECHAEWIPLGTTLDLRSAHQREIELLLATTEPLVNPGALVATLNDWQDSDSIVGANGAERAWYRSRARLGPRDAAIEDVEEMRLIKGWENVDLSKMPIGLTDDRISLDHAPRELLALLPGFTDEVVALVVARRESANPVSSLGELVDAVSEGAALRLQSAFGALERRVVAGTDAWMLRTTAVEGSRGIRITVSARVERRGGRLEVIRESIE